MERNSGDYQRAVENMVRREVHYCVSNLVSTLAEAYGNSTDERTLDFLCEQAADLVSPIADYEEAAIQAGWTPTTAPLEYLRPGGVDYTRLCEDLDIEPIDREVFEHWIVSGWLADKLEAKGEKVDRDFAGLIVWARTTTGRAISMDDVICDIYDDTQRPLEERLAEYEAAAR